MIYLLVCSVIALKVYFDIVGFVEIGCCWFPFSNFLMIISDECQRTLPMISQHWVRKWLGAVRQQAIDWISVDQDIQRHMASLGHNELITTGVYCFHYHSLCTALKRAPKGIRYQLVFTFISILITLRLERHQFYAWASKCGLFTILVLQRSVIDVMEFFYDPCVRTWKQASYFIMVRLFSIII